MTRSLQAVLVFALLGVAVAAWSSTADAGRADEQTRRWIGQLDAEHFVDREVATERLIKAGPVVIDAVQAAAQEGNLEVTTRAVYILRELALSPDDAVADAAHAALERVAAPKLTSAARRAQATLARLDSIRQDRAIAELKRLGAVIDSRASALGLGIIEGYTIELGDSWRGEVQDLARLRWLRDAGELIVVGPRVTDEWLAYLAPLTDLTVLTIKRANITDDGLAHLLGMKRLSLLSLLYVPVTDHVVAQLQQLRGIVRIRIYGSQMTESGADRLRQALAATEIDFRRGAFLGIGCEDHGDGCIILRVSANSAAEKAGLQLNDMVYEYEDRRVADFKALTAAIAGNAAGDTVTLKIIRDGQSLSKRVTLGEWE